MGFSLYRNQYQKPTLRAKLFGRDAVTSTNPDEAAMADELDGPPVPYKMKVDTITPEIREYARRDPNALELTEFNDGRPKGGYQGDPSKRLRGGPPAPYSLQVEKETPELIEYLRRDPNGMDSEPWGDQKPPAQEKKQGFFSKIMDGLKGNAEVSQTDEYGLTKPKSSGIGDKIASVASYALPAIFGLTTGMGVVPGLMAGLKGSAKRASSRAENVSEYNKTLASARKSDAELAWKKKYQGDLLEIAKAKLAKSLGKGNGKVGDGGGDDALTRLTPDEKNSIAKMDDNQLIMATGDPDKDVRSAAKYVLGKRRKSLMGRQDAITVNMSGGDDPLAGLPTSE